MSNHQAFEVHSQFGIDALTCVDRPKPVLKPRQVLVKINAVALNYQTI